MRVMEELSNFIDEELDDAEKYINEAHKYRSSDMALAEVFYELSMEEINHAMRLHVQGMRLVENYKAKGETVPVAMQSVYDYLHAKQVAKTNEIKMLQSQFKD